MLLKINSPLDHLNSDENVSGIFHVDAVEDACRGRKAMAHCNAQKGLCDEPYIHVRNLREAFRDFIGNGVFDKAERIVDFDDSSSEGGIFDLFDHHQLSTAFAQQQQEQESVSRLPTGLHTRSCSCVVVIVESKPVLSG